MEKHSLPSIVQEILDAVWEQLEDADYENKAQVIIGGTFVLIDKDEFKELKDYVSNDIPSKTFDEIVQMK